MYINNNRMARHNAKTRRRVAKIKQILIGMALLAISALIIVVATQGTTMQDRDITAVVFTIPLGLFLLFTKEQIF